MAEDRPMEPTEAHEPTSGTEPSPGPEPIPDGGTTAAAVPDPSTSQSRQAAVEPGRGSDDGAPSRDEMSIAFTPGQLAVGGAVIAGLLVVGARFLLGRRRGRG